MILIELFDISVSFQFQNFPRTNFSRYEGLYDLHNRCTVQDSFCKYEYHPVMMNQYFGLHFLWMYFILNCLYKVGFENVESGNIKICKLINMEDRINVVGGQFLRKE